MHLRDFKPEKFSEWELTSVSNDQNTASIGARFKQLASFSHCEERSNHIYLSKKSAPIGVLYAYSSSFSMASL